MTELEVPFRLTPGAAAILDAQYVDFRGSSDGDESDAVALDAVRAAISAEGTAAVVRALFGHLQNYANVCHEGTKTLPAVALAWLEEAYERRQAPTDGLSWLFMGIEVGRPLEAMLELRGEAAESFVFDLGRLVFLVESIARTGRLGAWLAGSDVSAPPLRGLMRDLSPLRDLLESAGASSAYGWDSDCARHLGAAVSRWGARLCATAFVGLIALCLHRVEEERRDRTLHEAVSVAQKWTGGQQVLGWLEAELGGAQGDWPEPAGRETLVATLAVTSELVRAEAGLSAREASRLLHRADVLALLEEVKDWGVSRWDEFSDGVWPENAGNELKAATAAGSDLHSEAKAVVVRWGGEALGVMFRMVAGMVDGDVNGHNELLPFLVDAVNSVSTGEGVVARSTEWLAEAARHPLGAPPAPSRADDAATLALALAVSIVVAQARSASRPAAKGPRKDFTHRGARERRRRNPGGGERRRRR
ncbi:hypothetical protein GCM10022221_67230 [Actinocorallia aurea]